MRECACVCVCTHVRVFAVCVFEFLTSKYMLVFYLYALRAMYFRLGAPISSSNIISSSSSTSFRGLLSGAYPRSHSIGSIDTTYLDKAGWGGWLVT